jgi:hypothetical protein
MTVLPVKVGKTSPCALADQGKLWAGSAVKPCGLAAKGRALAGDCGPA